MKIPSKRELQQIAFNHSSYPCLGIDTALASDNSSRFRENLLE